MNDARLGDAEWKFIQRSVPVFCVDILVVRMVSGRLQPGLILRNTPAGLRWCLVGGRLLIDETVSAARAREWAAAFDPSFAPGRVWSDTPQLVEYSRRSTPGEPHDPRQHAVSATFTVEGHGQPRVRGPEAQDFRWFTLDELVHEPPGFGQMSVIEDLLGLAQSAAHHGG